MATKATGANQLIEQRLTQYLVSLEDILRADCLTYVGPIIFGVDDIVRDGVEAIPGKRKKLVFVLETGGGFAETARRIADVLRHHYETVDFMVPSFAMSAGTILALSEPVGLEMSSLSTANAMRRKNPRGTTPNTSPGSPELIVERRVGTAGRGYITAVPVSNGD